MPAGHWAHDVRNLDLGVAAVGQSYVGMAWEGHQSAAEGMAVDEDPYKVD